MFFLTNEATIWWNRWESVGKNRLGGRSTREVRRHPPKWPGQEASSVDFSMRYTASHHLPQAPSPPNGVPRLLPGPQGHGRALSLPPAACGAREGETAPWAQGCPLARGALGKCCYPRHLGEVLVYNIKTSLTLTFLWTKAFTLETSNVFLPIIMITEHVIPLLLFFLLSFDLSSRSCFLCSPGHCAPPSPSHLWETHAGTHGLYCRASLKARKKKTRSKSHKCSRCQVVPQDLYLTPSSGFAGPWQEINQKEKQSFSRTLFGFIINQGSVYTSQCLAQLQETFNESRVGLNPGYEPAYY